MSAVCAEASPGRPASATSALRHDDLRGPGEASAGRVAGTAVVRAGALGMTGLSMEEARAFAGRNLRRARVVDAASSLELTHEPTPTAPLDLVNAADEVALPA